AGFQGFAGAGDDVLDGERVLDVGDALHGAGVAPLLWPAAADDAGFLQVNMGLAQAGADHAAGGVVGGGSLGGEVRGDGSDAAILHADIDEVAGEAGV